MIDGVEDIEYENDPLIEEVTIKRGVRSPLLTRNRDRRNGQTNTNTNRYSWSQSSSGINTKTRTRSRARTRSGIGGDLVQSMKRGLAPRPSRGSSSLNWSTEFRLRILLGIALLLFFVLGAMWIKRIGKKIGLIGGDGDEVGFKGGDGSGLEKIGMGGKILSMFWHDGGSRMTSRSESEGEL
ncbi:hypothetical protein BCR39DRAFT_549797 [Naematelia encephala]|uniref:Uncharacterized protein n=1 Tax=Naematelia encephala TaxID=71784 RepID=A0A1Y2AKY6_9TREE|nr:hypothetical protein BCR39DRAFT_549797 [Naematelia encephala]